MQRMENGMTQQQSPVWFITGCSTGFGKELAKLVLARGWRAVVTARNPDRLTGLVSGHKENALALQLNVTDRAQIAQAVRQAEERFGRIDVLVNNAGYGYLADLRSLQFRRSLWSAGHQAQCISSVRQQCGCTACDTSRSTCEQEHAHHPIIRTITTILHSRESRAC